MPNWEHLRRETVAVQLSFLDIEANTGITFARIALQSNNRDKISRNIASARKAYDTITSYLLEMPPKTSGLEGIREKVATLEHMLHSLEDQV